MPLGAGRFYPAVVGAFGGPEAVKISDGGWRWEDFFRDPGVTGLRKGTLTYGPPRRHVCEDGVISDDEWNRRNEARRLAVLERRKQGVAGPPHAFSS
jgi:hypothetical protein